MGTGILYMASESPIGSPPFEGVPQHLGRSWHIPVPCRQVPPEGTICAPLSQSCVTLRTPPLCKEDSPALLVLSSIGIKC